MCNYLITKYNLEVYTPEKGEDVYKRNKAKLEQFGDGDRYNFDKCVLIRTAEGRAAHIEDLPAVGRNTVTIRHEMTNYFLGRKFEAQLWTIASKVRLTPKIVRRIVKTLFRRRIPSDGVKRNEFGLVLNMTNRELQVFLINNSQQLRNDISEATYKTITKEDWGDTPVETVFMIPEHETVFLDFNIKNYTTFTSNVYKDYTSDIIRSLPEKRLENALSKSRDVLWFYKNGDKGSRYFSIAYHVAGIMNLFFPDYLVMTKDGRLFIIEIKGGENISGQSRNIDKNAVMLKFNALNKYVEKRNTEPRDYPLAFAFVRDVEIADDLGTKSYKLFYNDTVWTEEMEDEWKPFESLFILK